MPAREGAVTTQREEWRRAVRGLTGYDEADEDNPSEVAPGPGRYVLRSDVLALLDDPEADPNG